jgi:hypothetical protein
MSKIYKRPMFRKGGEVMEGIMTGIKPRKKFEEGTKPSLEKLQGQLSLVDQLAGGTGVSPVSQLLISGGLNLLGGVGAGGTKLQELAAAFKQPSDQLFKNMAGERAQKRALAASLVSKMDNKKLDALRKAEFLIKRKPGESEADFNSRLNAEAAKIIRQKEFGVEERFKRKAKADSIKKIGDDFGLQAGVAENYYDFQNSQKRTDLEKEFAGKSFIGPIKKNKKGEYKTKNKQAGIYYDPFGEVAVIIDAAGAVQIR